MRKSKVLDKIHRGKCARVCGLGHYLPFFVRYAAHYHFDGIWFDLEHRAMDDREVQSVLTLAHYNDIDIMLRPPTTERTRLYRYLEDGATGFMIPFVSDAGTARSLVEAVKFPPMGNRGLDGAGLDADFALEYWDDPDAYIEGANRETFIVAQIETREALDNLDEIAAVEGIDLLFVGPGDLGTRLKFAEGLDLEEAIVLVAETAKKHGKAWGIPGSSPEAMARYHALGAQMLACGGDFSLIKVLEESGAEFDKLPGENDAG